MQVLLNGSAWFLTTARCKIIDTALSKLNEILLTTTDTQKPQLKYIPTGIIHYLVLKKHIDIYNSIQ